MESSTDFIIKKMIINRLPLPDDILENEIKSFCFHDRISGSKAIKLRHEINRLILDAISRTNGHSDSSEDWAFGLMYEDETLQLQATNCSRCGNYIYSEHMYRQDCKHLLCKCPRRLNR